MCSRKRERAAEQNPESDSESVCSNNTETQMACSRNAVTFNETEYNLFKVLFRDYTTGIIKLKTNDFMLRTMWIELSRVYNTKARELGLRGRPWTHMILVGQELVARYKGPHQDSVLTEIFGTSKIIPIFPVSLIGEISSNSALESRTGSILNCNKSTYIDVEGSKSMHIYAGEPFVGRGGLQSSKPFVGRVEVPSLRQLVDLCFNMMRAKFLTQNQFSIALNLVEEWLSSGQRYAWLMFLHNTDASLEEKANFLIQQMG